MLKIRRLKGTIGAKVFTDAGDYFGEIEEVNLMNNKVDGWRFKPGAILGRGKRPYNPTPIRQGNGRRCCGKQGSSTIQGRGRHG